MTETNKYTNPKGLEPGEILAALYNAAMPLGLGFLQASAKDMTTDEANELIIAAGPHRYFDYCMGRPLKLAIGVDGTIPRLDLYDRDQGGPGTALLVLARLEMEAAE